MTKEEIIEMIARQRKVENLIRKNDIRGERVENLEELSQDIYLLLLQRDDIVDMYGRDELDFFIQRLIKNNLFSKTSRYYYNYKKPWERMEELDDKKEK